MSTRGYPAIEIAGGRLRVMTWSIPEVMFSPLLMSIQAESLLGEDMSTFLRGIAKELTDLARKYDEENLFPEGINGNEPMLGGSLNPKR